MKKGKGPGRKSNFEVSEDASILDKILTAINHLKKKKWGSSKENIFKVLQGKGTSPEIEDALQHLSNARVIEKVK